MALILEGILTIDMAVAMLASFDTGTGFAYLLFETSGDVEVARIDFEDPSFSQATGILTLLGIPLTDASATGNASPVAQFSIFDKDDLKQLEGTVTTVGSGGDIELTSLIIAATEQVDLTALTITEPAS
jgi:hypothetical protein